MGITPIEFFSMYGITDEKDQDNIKTLCILFNGKVNRIYEKTTKAKEKSSVVV